MTRPEAMRLAREMYDGGWSVTKIQRYLNERGVSCVWETVKGWADPEWREERKLAQREAYRRYWRKRNGAAAFRVVDESALGVARERLRAATGLGDEQIDAVLSVTGVVNHLARGSDQPDLLARMRELRDEAGLSFASIAKVVRLDHGEDYSPEQIRYAFETGRPPARRRRRAAA